MENLKLLRKRAEKTQEEVASELHIPKPTYAHYESGRSQPDFDTLISIADYFGVSIDYLIGHKTASIIHLDSFNKKQQLAIDMIKKLDDDKLTLFLGRLSEATGTSVEEIWTKINS